MTSRASFGAGPAQAVDYIYFRRFSPKLPPWEHVDFRGVLIKLFLQPDIEGAQQRETDRQVDPGRDQQSCTAAGC